MSASEISSLLNIPIRTIGFWIKPDATIKNSLSKVKYRAKRFIQKFYSLYLKQGNACAGCGQRFEFWKLQRDHLHPKSKGGSNHISNYQLLCSYCNTLKGVGTNDDLQRRLLDTESIYAQAIAEYLQEDWDQAEVEEAI